MSALVSFAPPRPTPPAAPLPFFRFLRTLRTNALAMWPEAAYEQDFVRRRLLGATNLLVSAPDVVRRVLVDNPDNYRRTHASIRILRPITGDGLLLSTGDAWRLQRRTIAPALAPRMLPLLTRHITTATDEAVAQLDTQTDQPIDLLSVVQTLALDIAGRSMFSLQTRQHSAAMRAMLTEYGLSYARPNLFDMLLPASIVTPRDLRRRRFHRRWMALIEEIMRDRLQAPTAEVPRDLFDLLRAARDPETGAAFSDVELRDQVATMILAGHETTAVTLFWALLLLAESPATQDRVAAEATPLDLSPDHAAGALDQLVFTKAVISETLRLFPPAFLIVRQAIAADRVGNFDIPRGAVIMMAPWVLHRHRKLWRDPDVFDPTRFLPDAPPPARFSYLPFGAGPRVCVGAQFALAEANLVLASLARSFHIRRESTEPVLPVAVVTTQPDHAPLFRLTPRSSGLSDEHE
jgi:unspecific monooxygenase